MKGWKTWVSAVGLCVLGVYMIEKGQTDTGMACIFAGLGLGLVGTGHKVEKVSKGSTNATTNA